jgi:hypothetical protein
MLSSMMVVNNVQQRHVQIFLVDTLRDVANEFS